MAPHSSKAPFLPQRQGLASATRLGMFLMSLSLPWLGALAARIIELLA
jgi:hypothetical protein